MNDTPDNIATKQFRPIRPAGDTTNARFTDVQAHLNKLRLLVGGLVREDATL
jgi:hypothetical protein